MNLGGVVFVPNSIPGNLFQFFSSSPLPPLILSFSTVLSLSLPFGGRLVGSGTRQADVASLPPVKDGNGFFNARKPTPTYFQIYAAAQQREEARRF